VATYSRMTVHRGVIARYTLPGGKVYNYNRAISIEIERLAKATCPVRTGQLRASIAAGVVWANQHQTRFEVGASTPYAKYVTKQTFGKGMVKPLFGGSRRGTGSGKLYTLYGQRPGSWGVKSQYAGYQSAQVFGFDGYAANDFLPDAMHEVFAAHNLHLI